MDVQIQNINDASRVDLEKWAAIVIEKFEFAISKYNLVYSGDLLRSFQAIVQSESGGDNALISFAFNYYLKMLDMGVGKGVSIADAGTGKRKKYPVFNKILYAEIMRLGELLTEMYAINGAKIIVYGIKD
jgi:hypothetical protein